jgi:pimeloyl-ACP methyl ester carboxylesterase
MKKILIIMLIALLAILVALPIFFNKEKQILNAEIRSHADGNFIQLSDGYTHYEIAGPDKAPVVVLIHGATVPYYIWDPTFDALKESGLRVLRYDIYGRGLSDRPKVTYDRKLFEKQLYDLLQRLEIHEPVSLVGISMGGSIAAEFTVTYPNLVNKVVLIDPMHEAEKAPWLNIPLVGEYCWAIYSHSLPESQLGDFLQPERFPDWPERYREQMKYKGFRRAILSTMRNYFPKDKLKTYEQLDKLEKPVLLIWGKEDKTLPFSSSERLLKVLDAEFLPVEKAGHIPHYEHPEVVNPAIISFLKNEK